MTATKPAPSAPLIQSAPRPSSGLSARPAQSQRTGPDRPALGLAAFLGGAGVLHFVVPKFYDQMIPGWLPGTARQWTYGSGVVEAAVGAAVAAGPTRRRGARLAALLFVLVLPGNIQMVIDSFQRSRPPAEKAVLVGRLPLQIPLVWWALRVARGRRASAASDSGAATN